MAQQGATELGIQMQGEAACRARRQGEDPSSEGHDLLTQADAGAGQVVPIACIRWRRSGRTMWFSPTPYLRSVSHSDLGMPFQHLPTRSYEAVSRRGQLGLHPPDDEPYRPSGSEGGVSRLGEAAPSK